MKILRAYGIPEEIVDLIEKLYTDTKAQVLTPEELTELFDIMAGVLQGDTLAPYLFIIVADYCMKLTLENHPEIGFTLKPARKNGTKQSSWQTLSLLMILHCSLTMPLMLRLFYKL